MYTKTLPIPLKELESILGTTVVKPAKYSIRLELLHCRVRLHF